MLRHGAGNCSRNAFRLRLAPRRRFSSSSAWSLQRATGEPWVPREENAGIGENPLKIRENLLKMGEHPLKMGENG